jgi:hypothetical protein
MEMHLKSPSFSHESKPQILPLTGMRICSGDLGRRVSSDPSDCLLGQYMGSLPRPLFSSAATGYVAVGVFFVLSGFILALNYPLTGNLGELEENPLRNSALGAHLSCLSTRHFSCHTCKTPHTSPNSGGRTRPLTNLSSAIVVAGCRSYLEQAGQVPIE